VGTMGAVGMVGVMGGVGAVGTMGAVGGVGGGGVNYALWLGGGVFDFFVGLIHSLSDAALL